MAEKMIDIVMVKPGEQAFATQIADELHTLQQAVGGGYIECVPLGGGALIVCNDEGKLNGMSPNRRLGDDVIAGPFFICGSDNGEFISLSKQQLADWQAKFLEPQSIAPEEVADAFYIEVRSFDF